MIMMIGHELTLIECNLIELITFDMTSSYYEHRELIVKEIAIIGDRKWKIASDMSWSTWQLVEYYIFQSNWRNELMRLTAVTNDALMLTLVLFHITSMAMGGLISPPPSSSSPPPPPASSPLSLVLGFIKCPIKD